MLDKFTNHITTKFPFLKNKKLLVAISGGIDSVVLSHLLHQNKFNFALAHCNFKLRGKDSFKDASFVETLSKKYNRPLFSIEFDTKKIAEGNKESIQMAARSLRYNWFDKIAKENNYDFILTAHQNDDVLETFLINLSRGTGLNGLCGIPEINKNIVRPLLVFSRNEIFVYANKHHLKWREDKSNASDKYVRNKIRHQIVPVLKELNPNLLNAFNNTLSNLKSANKIFEESVKKSFNDISFTKKESIYFDIAKLKNKKELIYPIFSEYNFTDFNSIKDLLESQSGKQLFSKTHILLKDRSNLILSPIITNNPSIINISETTKEIKNPVHLLFEKIIIPADQKNQQNKAVETALFEDDNSVWVDLDLLKFPLTIRKWKKGDYFYPFGLGGKKKLSKFFKDQKLSLIEKEECWLLCSENKIVWVINYRLDDRFKIVSNTQNLYKISLKS
ncbi:MAG: tRNA lysidine(34) synthetase TilS [Lutibacter sp.]